jgi:hypothetical protein
VIDKPRSSKEDRACHNQERSERNHGKPWSAHTRITPTRLVGAFVSALTSGGV